MCSTSERSVSGGNAGLSMAGPFHVDRPIRTEVHVQRSVPHPVGRAPETAGHCLPQCPAVLPILHGAVIPKRSIEHLVHRRVLANCFFTQLNTETQALWHSEIAILKLQWPLQ